MQFCQVGDIPPTPDIGVSFGTVSVSISNIVVCVDHVHVNVLCHIPRQIQFGGFLKPPGLQNSLLASKTKLLGKISKINKS